MLLSSPFLGLLPLSLATLAVELSRQYQSDDESEESSNDHRVDESIHIPYVSGDRVFDQHPEL